MRRAVVALGMLAACFGGGDDDIRLVPDTEEQPTFQGTVAVSPEQVDIVAEPGGEFAIGTLSVLNVGEYPLELRSVTLDGGNTDVLSTDEATNSGRSIGPDRNFEVLVRCDLPLDDTDVSDTDPDAGVVTGTLVVRTNDVDNSRVRVPVTCSSDG